MCPAHDSRGKVAEFQFKGKSVAVPENRIGVSIPFANHCPVPLLLDISPHTNEE
jgi:hypothetical protein